MIRNNYYGMGTIDSNLIISKIKNYIKINKSPYDVNSNCDNLLFDSTCFDLKMECTVF